MARTKHAKAPVAPRPPRSHKKKVEENLKDMKEVPVVPAAVPTPPPPPVEEVKAEIPSPVNPPVEHVNPPAMDISPRMQRILKKQAISDAKPKPPPPPKPDVINKPPEQAKMKFQLISGKHEINVKLDPATGRMQRRRLTTGDIVETEVDLCAVFPNRFKRIMPEEVQKKASSGSANRASVLTQTTTAEAAKRGKGPTKVRVMNRGGERYDVIREDNGLPLNDKFLSLEDAKDLELKMNAAADEAEKNPPPKPAARPKLRPPNPNPMLI